MSAPEDMYFGAVGRRLRGFGLDTGYRGLDNLKLYVVIVFLTVPIVVAV